MSEDEFPSVKKEGGKRKIGETDYDPGSPTSENEIPTKKPNVDTETEKDKDEKKVKKLPELDKYWKAVNDDPSDFTGWTYLLQYVDQEVFIYFYILLFFLKVSSVLLFVVGKLNIKPDV